MTAYICDRCGESFKNRSDVLRITGVNLDGTTNYAIDVELCSQCQNSLKDFCKPLAKPTETKKGN